MDQEISLLDAVHGVKQRDALFRALYKCTVLVVVEPTRFETNLIQQLCKLIISVVRKFCTALSRVDLFGLRIALKMCSRTFSDISSKDELEGVWRSIEVLELVDWFSRSVHKYRWQSRVEEVQCPATQVEGSHANDLKQMGHKSEANCETSCFCEACLLFHRVEEVLNWIVQLPLSSTFDEIKNEKNHGILPMEDGRVTCLVCSKKEMSL